MDPEIVIPNTLIEALDTTPICNVFEGDEAFWTKRYTGKNGATTRALANRTETEKEYHRQACGKATQNYYLNCSQEKYEADGRARSKGLRDMPEEAKLKRSANFRHTMDNRPESEKEAHHKKLSEKAQEMWDGYNVEEHSIHCNAIAEGINSMTETAKKRKSEASSKYMKEYIASLSETELSEYVRIRNKGNRTPNKAELMLGGYLTRKFPDKWEFNGQCQQSIVLGGKIPDFVDIDNKEIIELFGTHFHLPEEEPKLIQHYKNLGWSCIVIWEYDVYIEEELNKILKVESLK